MRAHRCLALSGAFAVATGCNVVPPANIHVTSAHAVGIEGSSAPTPPRAGLTGRAAMPLAPWVLSGVFTTHVVPTTSRGIDATAERESGAVAIGDATVRQALLGHWYRRASWLDRDGVHVQRECALSVSEQGASERCSDAFDAVPGATAPCSRGGRPRVRVLAVAYRWSVSAGDVEFTPTSSTPRVERDTGCEPEEAESFPVMRTHWDGIGARLELIGTSTASGVAPLVYVRQI